MSAKTQLFRTTSWWICYFVSATVLSNSLEDVWGVIVMLQKYLQNSRLGVTATLQRRKAQKIPVTLTDYIKWHEKYDNEIKSYNDSRFLGSVKLPAKAHPGFWDPKGKTPSDRYGLFLLDADTIRSVMDDPLNRSMTGKLTPSLARNVIGFVMKASSIVRNANTQINISSEGEEPVFVTAGQNIPEPTVSTVDIMPTGSSDKLYQEHFASLHDSLVLVQHDEEAANQDPKLDPAVDRLLSLGALNPHLGWIGTKTVLIRLLRRSKKAKALTAKDLELGGKDEESIQSARYPLPYEANKCKDNAASWLYLMLKNDPEATIPATRLPILQLLLKDAPKAMYVL